MNMKQMLTAVALMLATLTATAAELPSYYYPDPPVRTGGTVGRIDGKKQLIVIADSLYNLSNRVIVHTVDSEFAPLSQVSPGSTVKFRYMATQSGDRLITEIWVMPTGYTRAR